MPKNCRVWTLLTIGVGIAGTVGCSDDQPNARWKDGTNVGTVQVALTGSAPSGVSYHLQNAVFEITNFALFPPIDMQISGDDPTLSVELPPSVFPFDYFINLHDGWTLSEVLADGSERPVTATLLDNFQPFTIKPQRKTPIVFHFKASEQVITTGNGTASVTVSVDDTLIDDFEDGDGLIAPIGGRNGAWFTFSDGSGTLTPPAGSPVVPVVVDTSANYLFDMTLTGFASQGTLPNGGAAFGAGVGAGMLNDPATGKALPYDASHYSGINFTFFTRTGQSFPVLVSFLVGTSATTPVDQGGTCTSGCFDDFGFVGTVPPGDFGFTGGFTWGQLTQQGFGTPAVFDPATIMNVKWIVAFPNFGQPTSEDNAEFRVDDVTFTSNPFGGGTSGGGSGSGGSGGGGRPDGGVPVPIPVDGGVRKLNTF